MQYNNFVYNWNELSERNKNIEIYDETLRDGLQATNIINPKVEDKFRLIKLMDELNINLASIGFLSSGEKIYNDAEEIIKYTRDNKLQIGLACVSEMKEKDIDTIAELAQKTGFPLEANIFIGSSMIRQHLEGWDLDYILNIVKSSVERAVKHGLNCGLITEDTTRSRPEDIKKIYQTAIEYGAKRICLCDTVGSANPRGTAKLVTYIKDMLMESNSNHIKIEWHGHNDRGMALANAMAAVNAGADRIHATILGIGERTGNTPMELLLMNLNEDGIQSVDMKKLKEYCLTAAELFQSDIPDNYPIIGSNAFKTSSGVHASAIYRAMEQKEMWFADRVYSNIPAKDVGSEQSVEIGPMSDRYNVRYWMDKNNIVINEEIETIILENAKRNNKCLSDLDLMDILSENNIGLEAFQKNAEEFEKRRNVKKDVLEKDRILLGFLNQREYLKRYLKTHKNLTVCTLGPIGTTSHNATEYFVDYLKELDSLNNYTITTKSHFDYVYQALVDGEADVVVIPNAYDKIADVYWDNRLDNLFSFLSKTPAYGIVCDAEDIVADADKVLRISCCRPVFSLIEKLGQDILGKFKSYEIVEVYSNYQAAEYLFDKKVDLAVTNELICKNFNFHFISPIWNSNFLWTTFIKKED